MGDLRLGWRALRRTPGFTVAALVALALGIGANTAIFTVVDGVLFRPLPYGRPDRLVAVFAHETLRGEPRNPTSPADFLAWKEGSRTLEGMTAARPWSPVLDGTGEPLQVAGLRATPDLFDLLGVEPALGRVYRPSTDSLDDVIVISHRLWRGRFGGDREILGRNVRLDGRPFTIIGVMPAGFRFPPFWAVDASFWAPLVLTDEDRSDRSFFLRAFARLRPGASVAQAGEELNTIAARIEQDHPDTNAGIRVNVEPLREPVVGGARPALALVFGIVGFVLLIACADVANLSLARGASRRRELAVRSALGADRLRLFRQLLAESLLLGSLGAVAGLALGAWGVDLLISLGPAGIPRLQEIGMSPRAFGFTLALGLVAGVGFGVLPAFQAARTDPAAGLQPAGRGIAGAGTNRISRWLVGVEVALAALALIGAGLLIRSFDRLHRIDPGFRAEGVAVASLSLAGAPAGEPSRQPLFLREAVRQVETLPGVERAAAVNHLPIGGDVWRTQIVAEGDEVPGEPPRASYRVITPGYFEAMGIPLLRGRPFDGRDGESTEPVAIVNRFLARQHWGDEDPIGKRVRTGWNADSPWRTVVGMVGNVHQGRLDREWMREIYFPYSQNPSAWWKTATLVTRGGVPPERLSALLKTTVHGIDGGVPVSDLRSMSTIVSASLAEERFQAQLLSAFAGVALLLAVVGIYGVVSYWVSRRIPEIGIRMALGASRREIVLLVVRHGMLPTLAGLGAGLGLALGLSRLMAGMLHEVGPSDPLTYAGVLAVLAATGLLACAVPARRAARLDPVSSLRHD